MWSTSGLSSSSIPEGACALHCLLLSIAEGARALHCLLLSIPEGAWKIVLPPCLPLRVLEPYDWHWNSIDSYLRVHEPWYCLSFVHPWGCMSDYIASLSIPEIAWSIWIDIELALIHTWGCMSGCIASLFIHQGAWAIALPPCLSMSVLEPCDWHSVTPCFVIVNGWLQCNNRYLWHDWSNHRQVSNF